MSRSTTREPIPPTARRAGVAGLVGTFIEYYDFGLYATLTVYFAPLFFPAENPATSLLTGLAVYGAGFVARPLGAIVFGRIGDRRGRRAALIATVLAMGTCSALIGLLPTYAVLGVLAPVLLVLLRLGQGLSAGAELLGSVTYAIESAPPSRRVFLASLTSVGAVLGGAIGPLVAFVLVRLVGPEAMTSWGWRLAFFLVVPMTVVAYLVRTRLEDSPEFAEMVARNEIVKAPLREAFARHWRAMLVAGGVAIAANGASGLGQWFATFLAGTRKLPASDVFLATAIGMLIAAALVPVAGQVTDRFGQRRVATAVLVGFVVAVVPVLWLLGTTTSLAGMTVGIAVFVILGAVIQPPCYSFIAERFPRNVRYTGSAFAQNIGTVLAAGPAPLVAGLLLAGTGSWAGPAIWIGVVCAIGFVAFALAAAADRPHTPDTPGGTPTDRSLPTGPLDEQPA